MDDDGASTSKGTGSKGNKSRDDDAEDDERDNMSREERQIFDAKFKELQVYMPMLKKFLNVYEQKRGQEHDLASEKQFHRFRSLYALFTSKKRCKLDTLYKCEEFFKKRFKVSECPNETKPNEVPPTPATPPLKKKCKACSKRNLAYPHADDCVCCNCAPALNRSECPGPIAPGETYSDEPTAIPESSAKKSNSIPNPVKDDCDPLKKRNNSPSTSGIKPSKPTEQPKAGLSVVNSDIIVLTDDEDPPPKIPPNKEDNSLKSKPRTAGSSSAPLKSSKTDQKKDGCEPNKAPSAGSATTNSNLKPTKTDEHKNECEQRKVSSAGIASSNPGSAPGNEDKVTAGSKSSANKAPVKGTIVVDSRPSISEKSRNSDSLGQQKSSSKNNSDSSEASKKDRPSRWSDLPNSNKQNDSHSKPTFSGKSNDQPSRWSDSPSSGKPNDSQGKPKVSEKSGRTLSSSEKRDLGKSKNDIGDARNKMPNSSRSDASSGSKNNPQDISAGISLNTGLFNIPDLSHIEIPEGVSEIVKSISRTMPNSYSNPNQPSTPTIPFHDDFDVEPLHPSDSNYSLSNEVVNSIGNLGISRKPHFDESNSSSSRSPASPHYSHNFHSATTSNTSNSLNHNSNSVSNTGNQGHPEKRGPLSDPRRRSSANPEAAPAALHSNYSQSPYTPATKSWSKDSYVPPQVNSSSYPSQSNFASSSNDMSYHHSTHSNQQNMPPSNYSNYSEYPASYQYGSPVYSTQVYPPSTTTRGYHHPRTSSDYHARTGTDSYSRTGADNYSRTGADNYSRTGADNHTRTGADNYTRTGVDSYSRTGADSYSRTGVDSYSRTGADSYSRTGADSYSRTGADSYSRTGADSYSRTGADSYSRTGADNYSRTGADNHPRAAPFLPRTVDDPRTAPHHPRTVPDDPRTAPNRSRIAHVPKGIEPSNSSQDSYFGDDHMEMSPESPKSDNIRTPSSNEKESSTPSIRSKLAEGFSTLKKLGKSNLADDKQRKERILTSLKPGVVDELAASSEIRNSLFVDSLKTVPSSDRRKDPSSNATPIKHPSKVGEKNLDTINSLKTNVSKVNPLRAPIPKPNINRKTPLLPTPPTGKIDSEKLGRLPDWKSPGQKISPGNRSNSSNSFDQSIRTCFSANNETNTRGAGFNETMRTSFHPPSESANVNRTYSSKQKEFNSSYKPADIASRSHSSSNSLDVRSEASTKPSRDSHLSSSYPRGRPEDLHATNQRPSSDSSRHRNRTSDPRSNRDPVSVNKSRERQSEGIPSTQDRDPRRRPSLELDQSCDRDKKRNPVNDLARTRVDRVRKISDADEKEEFSSPLDNNARKPHVPVTGRGYGIQGYKIPKKPRPQPSLKDSFPQDRERNARPQPPRNDSAPQDRERNSRPQPPLNDSVTQDREKSMKQLSGKKDNSRESDNKQTIPAASKIDEADVNLLDNGIDDDVLSLSEFNETDSDFLKHDSKTNVPSKQSEKNNGKPNKKPLLSEDSHPAKEDLSTKPLKTSNSSNKVKENIKIKLPKEDYSKVKIGVTFKTPCVVISSDEESLARSEGKTKMYQVPKQSSKVNVSKKRNSIESSSDDECNTANASKKDSSVTAKDSSNSPKAKVKPKNRIRPITISSEDSDTEIIIHQKSNKKLYEIMKATLGSLDSDSDSDVAFSKHSSAKNTQDVADTSSKDSGSEGSDLNRGIQRKKVSRSKCRVSKDSESSLDEERQTFPDGSTNKSKPSKKNRTTGMKLSDFQVSSSKKSNSSQIDSSLSASIKSTKCRTKQRLKSNQQSSIFDTSSSSDDELLAKKFQKIRKVSSSENVSEDSIGFSGKKPVSNEEKPSSKEEISGKEKENLEKRKSEDVPATKSVKIDQISCNKVDSTSDTNDAGADKIACETPSDPLSTLVNKIACETPSDPLSSLVSQLTQSNALDGILFSMMFKSIQDKFGPKFFENIEVMKKLMEGDTLEKVKKILDSESKESSSSTSQNENAKANTSETSQETASNVEKVADTTHVASNSETVNVPLKSNNDQTLENSSQSSQSVNKDLTLTNKAKLSSIDQTPPGKPEPAREPEPASKPELASKPEPASTPEPASKPEPAAKEPENSNRLESAAKKPETLNRLESAAKETEISNELNSAAKESETSNRPESVAKESETSDRLESAANELQTPNSHQNSVTAVDNTPIDDQPAESKSSNMDPPAGNVTNCQTAENSDSNPDQEVLEVAAITEQQPKKRRRRGAKLKMTKHSSAQKKLARDNYMQSKISIFGFPESASSKSNATEGSSDGTAKELETCPKTGKKRGKNELDKLHEDIRESYIAHDVLTATGMRACRVKTYDMDRSLSPTDSPEKTVNPLRAFRKKLSEKSSENSENFSISSNLNCARVCKRKVSAYVDSSDSEDINSPKKPKTDSFIESYPPPLEVPMDNKGTKSIAGKKRPSSSLKITDDVSVPTACDPPLEIIPPAIDPLFFFQVPEIYALDYFSSKFRRRKFDLSLFKSKYISVTDNVCTEASSYASRNTEIRFRGSGRRLGQRRKKNLGNSDGTSIIKISTLKAGEKAKSSLKISGSVSMKNKFVSSLSKVPANKTNIASSNSMSKKRSRYSCVGSEDNDLSNVSKLVKTAESKESSKNWSQHQPTCESEDKSKVFEEARKALRMKIDASMNEPDLNDFILVVDKKSQNLTSVRQEVDSKFSEKVANKFVLKSKINWTDPEYYFKPGTNMDCKLCSYNGRYISDHYLLYHCEDQVLSSRLFLEEGESAIAESLFLNYSDIPDEFLIRFPQSCEKNGSIINKACLNKHLLKKWLEDHSEDLNSIFKSLINNCLWKKGDSKFLPGLKALRSKLPSQLAEFFYHLYCSKIQTNLFYCRMCSDIFDNSRKFFEHISLHTGEFLFECTPCQFILPSVNDFVAHQDMTPGDHFLTNRYPLPSDSSILFGYICSSCLYVQLIYDNLLLHLSMHSDDKVKPHVIRINMSKSAPTFCADSSEEVNIKRWHDYKKEDVSSCSCPEFCSSNRDLVCLTERFNEFSLSENFEKTRHDSSAVTNPFLKQYSPHSTLHVKKKLHKRYYNMLSQKHNLPSADSLIKSCDYKFRKNGHFVDCSNFSEALIELSNGRKGSLLFSEILKSNPDFVRDTYFPEDLEGKGSLSCEHNYSLSSFASSRSTKNSFSPLKEDKSKNSYQSPGTFLENLNKRLRSNGGKNYLAEFEKKNKPVVEVPVFDLTDELVLDHSNQGSSSASQIQGNIFEAEVPTIHIPETTECQMPNLLNVIDFNLQTTGTGSSSIVRPNALSDAFIDLNSSCTSSDVSKSSSDVNKNPKVLPNLIALNKWEKIEKFKMKDPAVTKIIVGQVGAMKKDDFVSFVCFVNTSRVKIVKLTCDFKTDSFSELINHFSTAHPTVRWNGFCGPCGRILVHKSHENHPVKLACLHLMQEHLTVSKTAPQNSTVKISDVKKDASEGNLSATVAISKTPTTSSTISQLRLPIVVSASSVTTAEPQQITAVSTSEPAITTAATGAAPPSQPKLRVRPMSDLIDVNLLNRGLFNAPDTEKESEGTIQIESVVSLSTLENDPSLDFGMPETSQNVSEILPQTITPAAPNNIVSPAQLEQHPNAYQLLDKMDRILFMTSSGPRRLIAWAKKDVPNTDSNPPTIGKKQNFKLRIAGSSKMDELLKNQPISKANQYKNSCPTGVLFFFCKYCSIYHTINFDTMALDCPKYPRILVIPSSELKFIINEPLLAPKRMPKHNVFPLTIIPERMKHHGCLEKMLKNQFCMRSLYKCMGNLCSFTTNDSDSFTRHVQNHESYLRALGRKQCKKAMFKRIAKFKDWNTCAYCGYSSAGPIDLKEHIDDEHGRSQYQCGHCFYRAFSLYHVAWHQVYAHENSEPVILGVPPIVNSKSFTTQISDVLRPYVCGVGTCKFQAYDRQSFKDHLTEQHIHCNVLICHECQGNYFSIDKLLMHYKLHRYCLYQCLSCLHGVETIEEMKMHLLNNHFSRPALVIHRILPNEQQKQMQRHPSWLTKNHLEDKIVVQSLKETKGNVRAIPANPLEPEPVFDEDITVEEDFYVQWMLAFDEMRSSKTVAQDSASRSAAYANKIADVEELLVTTGNDAGKQSAGTLQPNISLLGSETGESSDSLQVFVPTTLTTDGSEQSDMDPLLTMPTISSARAKELEERKTLHKTTLESRLKDLDSVFSCVKDQNLSTFDASDFQVTKTLLNKSFDDSSFVPYLPETDDFNKKSEDFELTEESINSLSLNLNDDVDLSTLYESHGSCGSVPVISQSYNDGEIDSSVNSSSESRLLAANPSLDNSEDSGLSGFDLYRCGNEGCPFSAETSNELKDHVSMCDLSRSSSCLTCVHCKKLFKFASSLVDHLRTHGTQRFFCSLCSMRASVPHRIGTHMKAAHRITSTRLHPVNPLQTNIDTSVFIVVPKDKQLIGVNKWNPKTGCKISFGTSEINEIPPQKIYSEPMWCAQCPYNSMVRINLYNHLRTHAIGIEPLFKDYFNPLSINDSKEQEPLTNHALSARMAEEKAMKEDGAPVLTEHILEDLHCNYQTEFVPLNGRYKCHVDDCSYITIDVSTLSNHLKSLHSDTKTYLCPHCPRDLVEPVKLDKIGSHLKFHDESLHKCAYCDFYHYKKYIVDRHVVLEHPSLAQKTDRIRGSDSDATHDSAESSQNNADAQRSNMKPWHCGLCRYRTLNRDDIAIHCFSVHGVYCQYKCVLCPFSDNSLYDFGAHYFKKHPGFSKQILCVFEEVTSVPGENDPVNDAMASRDICHYIPEKFRLKSGLAEERVSLSVEEYIKHKGRCRMLAKLGIDDKAGLHGPVGEPDSNGNFVCPRCSEYRTANVEDMKCHMYRELNYKLFKCGHCNMASSQFHDLLIHSEEHMRLGDDPCIQQLEPNPDYDAWIDRMIATQKSMMKSKKEGQGKDDPPIFENKFWRFGICQRECMPSYQRFCPDIKIHQPIEDDKEDSKDKNISKKYRQPSLSDDSDCDNFIDIILSDSDDDCRYNLAAESVPPPSESVHSTLSTYNSKYANYRKSKMLPKMDLVPPELKVTDESDLVFNADSESSDEDVIVDSDGDSPIFSTEGSLNSSFTEDYSSAAEKELKYLCKDCGKRTSSLTSLKNHIRAIHLGIKKYTCNVCQEGFLTINYIKNHLLRFHNDSVGRNFTTNEAYLTPEFWQEVYQLQQEDSSKIKPRKDKSTAESCEDLKFSCAYCAFKSNNISSIFLHWKQRHKEAVYLTTSKIKMFTNVPFKYRSSEGESASPANKSMYECVICKSRGSAEELIAHHIKSHPSADFQMICIGTTKYECVICRLHFNSVDSMKRHFSLDHHDRSVQYNIVPSSSNARFDDSEKSKSSRAFSETSSVSGKFIFYRCPLCPYFSDDSKKMHHHLRKHLDVFTCSCCKRRFPDNDSARAHQCLSFGGKAEGIKKCRLSKKSWDKLKTSVGVFEKPITESLLKTKYLPVKMSPRKRKHRSKGIPQKTDTKRMKFAHCAKKSTSAISSFHPIASTSNNSSSIKVNQTARKSTDPKLKSHASQAPFSYYGKKPEPCDLSSLYITVNIGGSAVLRPVSVLSSLMGMNLNPIVKVVDVKKKNISTFKDREIVEIN